MLNSIEKSNFVVACCVTKKSAGLISLSKMLQIKQVDIFSTDELIESVQLAFHNDKKNCENSFKQILTQVKNFCQKYEIPLMIPRIANRQNHRENYSINKE